MLYQRSKNKFNSSLKHTKNILFTKKREFNRVPSVHIVTFNEKTFNGNYRKNSFSTFLKSCLYLQNKHRQHKYTYM